MRLNPLSGRGMMKEVVHPNGVTLPDGQKIPHGAWLGVSLSGINHDERYYADPDTFDPFRFSRARTEIALMGKEEKERNKIASASATTATIDDDSSATAITTTTVSENNNAAAAAAATTAAVDVDYKKIIDNSDMTTPTTTTTDTTDHRNNKLNGSWLSTTAEDFGTFGYGRHAW